MDEQKLDNKTGNKPESEIEKVTEQQNIENPQNVEKNSKVEKNIEQQNIEKNSKVEKNTEQQNIEKLNSLESKTMRQRVTKPEANVKLKNPKKVEAGRKGAEVRKHKLMKLEEDNNKYAEAQDTYNISSAIPFIGTGVLIVGGLYFFNYYKSNYKSKNKRYDGRYAEEEKINKNNLEKSNSDYKSNSDFVKSTLKIFNFFV